MGVQLSRRLFLVTQLRNYGSLLPKGKKIRLSYFEEDPGSLAVSCGRKRDLGVGMD